MPVRYENGGHVVEMRRVTPGVAASVLKEARELDAQNAERAKALQDAADERMKALEPLQSAMERVRDGVLHGEAADAARRALIDRMDVHRKATGESRAEVAKAADVTRGLLFSATLVTPSVPARGEQLRHPWLYGIVEHLQDAHGWEEDDIATWAHVALKHLEQCASRMHSVDLGLVNQILGNGRAAAEGGTSSSPTGSGSTVPEASTA